MDDPVEEGYLDDYEEILGATEKVRYSPYPSVNCVAFCISFINTLYKTTELSGKTIRQAVHKNIQ